MLVQIPPDGVFNRDALQWEVLKGFSDNIACERARFPFDRLQDFISGESLRGETSFYQTNVLRKDIIARPRYDSVKWAARFHCGHGPEDDRPRDVELVALSQKEETGGRVSKKQKGLGQKKGCQCSFRAKQLYLDQTVVEVSYYHAEHRDEAGVLCHGSSDLTAAGPKAQGAVRKRAKKQQEQTSMAILGSCNSPYDNVVIPSFECGPALVCSSEDPERVYIICD